MPVNLTKALADNYPEGVKYPKCIGIVQRLSVTDRARTCRVAFHGRRLPKDRRTWVAQIFSLTGQERSSPKDSDLAVGPSINSLVSERKLTLAVSWKKKDRKRLVIPSVLRTNRKTSLGKFWVNYIER
jgi:hypothetical protein